MLKLKNANTVLLLGRPIAMLGLAPRNRFGKKILATVLGVLAQLPRRRSREQYAVLKTDVLKACQGFGKKSWHIALHMLKTSIK